MKISELVELAHKELTDEISQLEAELGLMGAEVEQFAEGTELVPKGTLAENKRLRELFPKGQVMDESRTWFWDDDIVTALGDE